MQQAGITDHSGAVWGLGLALVVAVMLTSPYWQGVGTAVLSGQAPSAPSSGSGAGQNGCLASAGALVLVGILGALAQVSEGMGGVALMLIIGLWVLFLLGHAGQVTGIFQKL